MGNALLNALQDFMKIWKIIVLNVQQIASHVMMEYVHRAIINFTSLLNVLI